jgi:hypothetical protein
MNATTVTVDPAKNGLEHYSLSWLASAAAELKVNSLDSTTITLLCALFSVLCFWIPDYSSYA